MQAAPAGSGDARVRYRDAFQDALILSGVAPDRATVLSRPVAARILATAGHRIQAHCIAAPALALLAPDLGSEIWVLDDVVGAAADLLDRQAARVIEG